MNDVAVLRSLLGPELVEALEERLTPARRETLRARLVPSRWSEEEPGFHPVEAALARLDRGTASSARPARPARRG